MPVTNILVEAAILECDAHNGGQPEVDALRRRVLVNEIYLDILNRRGPAIEAKHFICEVDNFLRSEIVDLAAACTGACGDVFGAKLFLQPRLKRGDFNGRVFGYRRGSVSERVGGMDCILVLISRRGHCIGAGEVEVVLEGGGHDIHTSWSDAKRVELQAATACGAVRVIVGETPSRLLVVPTLTSPFVAGYAHINKDTGRTIKKYIQNDASFLLILAIPPDDLYKPRSLLYRVEHLSVVPILVPYHLQALSLPFTMFPIIAIGLFTHATD